MMTELIGPYGRLLEVGPVTVSPDTTTARPSSEIVTLSGGRVVQRAVRATRRWGWTIEAGAAADLTNLVALEQGVYGPPPWRWYDPVAAKLNMLPAEVASPGLGGGWWHRWLSDDPDDVTLTVSVPAGVSSAVLLELPRRAGLADPVPVVEGRTYTGSVHVDGGTGSQVALRWVDVAGDVLSEDDDVTDVAGRWWVSGDAPAGAAGLLLTVETDGSVSRLQVTETVEPVGWHPGMGIPRVTVDGLSGAYRHMDAGRPIRDVSVELVEVDR